VVATGESFVRPRDRVTWTYAELLEWHLQRLKQERRTSFARFASVVGIHTLSLYRYRHGLALPSPRLRELVEASLFPTATTAEESAWKEEMRLAYLRARGIKPDPTPDLFNSEREWVSEILGAPQTTTGVQWVERNDQLAIKSLGTAADAAVAQELLSMQLHTAVRRKSKDFAEMARRLDNQAAWKGIADASKRFAERVDCESESIPDRLGFIYEAVIELGSFLEQDQRLAIEPDPIFDRLDVDIRRIFGDLIRTSAPWLRLFPTIRELDDQLGAFLLRPELLSAAAAVIPIAQHERLVAPIDAEILLALKDAAERGEVQGRKARTHTVHSVRNLVIRGAAVLATVYIGAVGSKLAEHSVIADRAARVLIAIENSVAELLADVPDDLRIALKTLIEAIKNNPPNPSS
jgi:hypothetical protein